MLGGAPATSDVARWRQFELPALLARHGLAGVPGEPFPTDGWSGSTFALFRRGSERFVLKRTSPARDWIVRSTADGDLREAVVACGGLRLEAPLRAPYLGAARDDVDPDGAAILMPDLSSVLLAWGRPTGSPAVSLATLDRILDAIARLHALLRREGSAAAPPGFPWCPIRERLLLLSPPAAEGYRGAGNPVGERFLAGWDAFARRAPRAAVELVDRLAADPDPLLRALGRLPATGLHGDLKLANVGLSGAGQVLLIDWQMATFAPVAVELGWLLVSNAAELPIPPGAVLERYRKAAGRAVAVTDGSAAGTGAPVAADEAETSVDRLLGDWSAQVDLAWIVGLLLRGWRKGLDAEAGVRLGSGMDAADDLRAWCRRAVEAAERRL